jgi:hypothetical protein
MEFNFQSSEDACLTASRRQGSQKTEVPLKLILHFFDYKQVREGLMVSKTAI